MPIAEIINEIDAYLYRLRQARDLLASPMAAARRKSLPRPDNDIKVGTSVSTLPNKPGIVRSKSRPVHPVPATKPAKKRVESIAEPSSVTQLAPPPPEQAQRPVSTQISAPDVNRDVPSHQKQTSPIRRVRRSITKPVIHRKPAAPKPAIALAEINNSKIVVVSAEQVLRERERAARPQVRPQRPLVSGLNGRLAFEALFKDEADPSKDSEQ